MLKRRINSASSSGFPQTSPYRVGSARSGEVSRKDTRCRPSSAPVTTFRHPHNVSANVGKVGKKKSLEDGSSLLKIEGKAIRSQNFNCNRKQTMKALSNFRHPFYIPKRKGLQNHKYNYTRSKLDPNVKYGISKSSFDLRREMPDRCEHINNDKLQSNSITEYTQKLLLNNFFIEGESEQKNDRNFQSVYDGNDSSTNVQPQIYNFNSYLTDEEDTEIRPIICLVSKPMLKASSVNDSYINTLTLRNSETDSGSNDDGSESTVLSLGQKIKKMAARNAKMPVNYFSTSNEDQFYNQDEWKHLLQYNHSLLLNEFDQDKTSDFKDSAQSNQDSEDIDTTEDSDIEVISVKENVDAKLSIGNTDKTTENEKVMQTHSLPISLKTNLHLSGKKFCAEFHDIIELENISEESSLKDETSETNKLISTYDQSGNKNQESSENKSKKNISFNLSDVKISEPIHEISIYEREAKETEENSIPLNSHLPQSTINSIKLEVETESLNTNKKLTNDNAINNGDTNLYKFKSFQRGSENFLKRFPIPPKRILKHQPKDILKALEMITIEQNKDREKTEMEYAARTNDNLETNNIINNNLSRTTDTAENAAGSENSFDLSVKHIIEKILIFAQDLELKLKSKTLNEEAKEKIFPDLGKAEIILDVICKKEKIKEDEKNLPEFHRECEERISKCQKELEERIHKNLELIRKLLDDKKILTEKYEELSTTATRKERCHIDKLKLLNDQHAIEMKSVKEKLSTADQIRREKWAQQKTKLIKDSTYRGLETKIKDLTTQHREEISRIKETHWKELREAEETWIQKLRDLEEQIKSKYEKEKEEECKREREREDERIQHEIRQSELVWQSRLDALQRQFSLNKIEKEEDTQRQIHRLNTDHESEIRNLKKEMDTIRDEYENKIRNSSRLHETERASMKQSNDRAQSDWRDQIVKDYEETKLKYEKELRERLRRQRDKEIEKAINEIQQETTIQIEEKQRSYDQKIKNLRDRYETELQDLEECEKISRTRYLEMKGLLTQREEEMVYLRARLHTQTMELNDYQQMFSNAD